MLVDVSLLRRALFYADGFALQLFDGIPGQGIFTRHEEHRTVVELVAKADLLFALLGHIHAGEDRVELTRLQRRDNAVEVAFHPHALGLQLGANRVAEVNIKTRQLTLRIFPFKRRKGGIDAKANFLIFCGQG